LQKNRVVFASQVFLNHPVVSFQKPLIRIGAAAGNERQAVLSTPFAAQTVRALEAEATT